MLILNLILIVKSQKSLISELRQNKVSSTAKMILSALQIGAVMIVPILTSNCPWKWFLVLSPQNLTETLNCTMSWKVTNSFLVLGLPFLSSNQSIWSLIFPVIYTWSHKLYTIYHVNWVSSCMHPRYPSIAVYQTSDRRAPVWLFGFCFNHSSCINKVIAVAVDAQLIQLLKGFWKWHFL